MSTDEKSKTLAASEKSFLQKLLDLSLKSFDFKAILSKSHLPISLFQQNQLSNEIIIELDAVLHEFTSTPRHAFALQWVEEQIAHPDDKLSDCLRNVASQLDSDELDSVLRKKLQTDIDFLDVSHLRLRTVQCEQGQIISQNLQLK